MKIPLVIIAGPTAVGKSHLAVELAKRIEGEVISCDSMQVYRGMNIGTAKVTPEETEGIPHHLIDIADPSDLFNVADYQAAAKSAISDIAGRGHIPILTGGTGFYIQAVLYDIDFSEEDGGDQEFRDEMIRLEQTNGSGYLHNRLKKVDPDSAASIHPNNTKRIIRALEFFEHTKTAISDHNRREAEKESPYNDAYFVISENRAVLYQRINRRVDNMFKQGFVGEVRDLIESGCTAEMTSMQALGYREILETLENSGMSEPEDQRALIDLIAKNTRHYAKRQITWFKREKKAEWLSFETMTEAEMIGRICQVLTEKGIIDETGMVSKSQ